MSAERPARGPQKARLAAALTATTLLLGIGLLKMAQRLPEPTMGSGVVELQQTPLSRACTGLGKNCKLARCCSVPGTQCYEKDHKWATCRRSCTPGRDPADKNPKPWTCMPLGPRKPGIAPQPNYEIQPAAWVADECSGPGQNCNQTKCCKEKGKQCYTKLPGWAACKPECVPGGPDVQDADSHPWQCKELGMRTPGAASGWGKASSWVETKCSKNFQNCIHSKCCQMPGTQCFKKNDQWAMCLDRCTPGPLLTDSDHMLWNCTPMGSRTPGVAPVQKNVKIAPWVKTWCSKKFTNCENTMCCRDDTMQCYQKQKGWATCSRSCEPGIHKGDKDNHTWTCDKIGTRTPRKWKSPSLYCFHVMMVNSYEAGLVRQEIALDGGAGIFACEQYDVFSQDAETYLGDGPLGEVRTIHFNAAPVGISIDGTAANTALFMNVWSAIKFVGRWKLTDWTVKADPDAVLIPDRLRMHLNGKPLKSYIVNCNKAGMATGPMMFGSVEALGRDALMEYYNREGECKSHYEYGEDRWLGDCLNKLSVKGIQDFAMVGDKVCTGANCGDGKAAYHHFKDVASWRQCYYTAKR